MNSIDDLKNLPEPVKKELLEYADYLLARYESKGKKVPGRKWVDVSTRGTSRGETASETVLKLRREERW
jgi:hypothetical protein